MRRQIAIPLLLVLLAAAAAAWWFGARRDPDAPGLVASGTVEATDAQLGFRVPGRLAAVTAQEGEAVLPGQELARLDRAEAEARRAQAAAQVAAARAALDELEHGSRSEEVARARAAAEAARERLADAERDAERARTLLAGAAVAREVLDKALLGLEVARAQRTQTEAELELVEKGPRPERIAAARAQLSQAQAALAAAETALADTLLNAPFAGLVTVRHRQPGEVVAAGAPVLTVMDPLDRWVRIYVPEHRLGAVRLGSRATITADTFPQKRYAGEVAHIAAEAEFTPRSVQTAEERVKLVYAVKVRILGDESNELKPGLPADVTLELGDV
jgi:HlyD family secretion protein